MSLTGKLLAAVLVPKPRYYATRFFTGTVGQGNANTIFTGVTTAGDTGTTHTCMEVPGHWKRFRLILGNQNTGGTITLVGASAVVIADPSTTAKKRADALFAASTPITFNDNGLSIAARNTGVSFTGPTLHKSDWCVLPSVDRTDVVGALPCLAVRVAVNCVAGTTEQITTWTRQGSDWGDGSIPFLYHKGQVGDCRASALNGDPTPGTTTSSCVLMGVEFETVNKSMTVLFTGNSIIASNAANLNARAFSWPGYSTKDVSTLAKPVFLCNIAISSNSAANYTGYASYAIPILRPTHVIHDAYSTNDISSAFGSAASVINPKTLLAKGYADAVGAQFAVINGIPRNQVNNATSPNDGSFFDSANSALAEAFKYTTIPALGYPVIDTSAAMSANTDPNRIPCTAFGDAADLTTDGTHPAQAGDVALRVPVTAYITAAKNVYLGGA